MMNSLPIKDLRAAFGERLQEDVSLANYTTAHLGGPADALLIATSADDIAQLASSLWKLQAPFKILGVGSNVLISDRGYRGVVIINHAHNIRIHAQGERPTVWAESGANMGTIARQVALRGLSGLEWAGIIPGSLGGAIYGNAGAHGGDMATSLHLAEILHRQLGRMTWTVDKLDYQYRSSRLKRQPDDVVILAGELKVKKSTPEEVQAAMNVFNTRRRSTQPPGASLGSIFRNPPGDHAGRLLEAAGLKGHRIGNVEISPIHANFFINIGGAKAADYWALIQFARKKVADKFGVNLELEIETFGEW
jgi:UDP-N-acetylmuramate dehydrogenase